MSYPVASGHAQLSGGYIPTLYALKLLREFYKSTVFGAIANTDYEDQIKQYGDTVVIRALPEPVISDYTKGQKLKYANLTPSDQSLLIDKGKSWSIGINSLDKMQSDVAYVNKWAAHASRKLQIEIDKAILADIYSSVHASNTGATAGVESGDINLGVLTAPLALTKANVLETIVDCGTVLDEQDVPEEDRWLILPSWATGLIKKSDLKDASLAGDGTSIMRNGRIGMIDNFSIYRSNNVDTATDTDKVWNCVFGHKIGLTFASQMTENETLKNPDDFGDLLRSLQVYGYKVVKPEALGRLYVKK